MPSNKPRKLKTSPQASRALVRDTDWEHPTKNLPEKVLLLGLGPSKDTYFNHLVGHNGKWEYDEVWVINTGVKFLPQADLAWVMDDMDLYTRHWPPYAEALQSFKGPIITNNIIYPAFPTAVSYPDHHVLTYFNGGYAYFNRSSLPWIFAYAVWLGVKKLALFGIDYSLPDRPDKTLEDGRNCAEWWAGFCAGRGIELVLPSSTTFMDRCLYPHFRPYGYLKPPALTINDMPAWL